MMKAARLVSWQAGYERAAKLARELECELTSITERANRGHRAYLCNQGIPEVDAEREANRVFPVFA